MNRSGSYAYDVTPRRRTEQRSRFGSMAMARTADVWLMNTIAVGLGLAALALFIVGMIVGTGVGADRTTDQNFFYGSIWLLGSIVLATAGLAFRREHPIPDAKAIARPH